MSGVELLNVGKKILGRLPKTTFSQYDYPFDRLMNLLAAPNHLFKPEIEVPDTGIEVETSGFLILIKVPPDGRPVKANFDRPITADEYTVVYPGVVKVVGRMTNTLYLKAPQGYSSKATVEVLRLG
jgi:hypothetical protein